MFHKLPQAVAGNLPSNASMSLCFLFIALNLNQASLSGQFAAWITYLVSFPFFPFLLFSPFCSCAAFFAVSYSSLKSIIQPMFYHFQWSVPMGTISQSFLHQFSTWLSLSHSLFCFLHKFDVPFSLQTVLYCSNRPQTRTRVRKESSKLCSWQTDSKWTAIMRVRDVPFLFSPPVSPCVSTFDYLHNGI